MTKKNRIGIATAISLLTVGALAAHGETTTGSELLGLYGRIHAALAADSVAGVGEAAAELAARAEAAAKNGAQAAAFEAVAVAASAVSGSDLETLREKHRALSMAMAKLTEAGALAGADLYYCPMADGYWLQESADAGARNPYYGKSMPKCGSKVDRVEG